MMIFVASISSCKKDDKTIPDELVGTWTLKDHSMTLETSNEDIQAMSKNLFEEIKRDMSSGEILLINKNGTGSFMDVVCTFSVQGRYLSMTGREGEGEDETITFSYIISQGDLILSIDGKSAILYEAETTEERNYINTHLTKLIFDLIFGK